MDKGCLHNNFKAEVKVARIALSENQRTKEYMADVTIKCADCLKDFVFVGLPCGVSFGQPMVSFGGIEARMPIREFQK